MLVPTGFPTAFAAAFGDILPALPQRRGRRPRVPLAKVLPALVFHVMSAAGTLAEHFAATLRGRHPVRQFAQ